MNLLIVSGIIWMVGAILQGLSGSAPMAGMYVAIGLMNVAVGIGQAS